MTPPRPEPARAGTGTPAAAAATPVGAAERLLRRLEWTVLRPLDGLRQGDVRCRRRGAGLDLAELREYQSADDVRHIDWNVTARSGVPHVREFLEERDMAVVFLLDLSESLSTGSARGPLRAGEAEPRRLRDAAVELTGVLARHFTQDGHRVGALVYRRGVERWLAPRGGRLQVLRLLQALEAAPLSPATPAALPDGAAPGRTRPGAAAGAAAGADAGAGSGAGGWRRWLRWPIRPRPAAVQEGTALDELLRQAETRLPRRCTLLLLSDFVSRPGWEAPLGRLALRHDLTVVRLDDPLLHELPAGGLLRLVDAETGDDLLVDADDPGLRQRLAAQAEAREAELSAVLARLGVDRFDLDSNEPLLAALQRFLALRRLRLRGRPATGAIRRAAGVTGQGAAAATAPAPAPAPEG